MRVCANIALTPSLRIVAGAACLFLPLNLVPDGCRWSFEGAALIRALARSAAVRELRHPLCGLHGLPGGQPMWDLLRCAAQQAYADPGVLAISCHARARQMLMGMPRPSAPPLRTMRVTRPHPHPAHAAAHPCAFLNPLLHRTHPNLNRLET